MSFFLRVNLMAFWDERYSYFIMFAYDDYAYYQHTK